LEADTIASVIPWFLLTAASDGGVQVFVFCTDVTPKFNRQTTTAAVGRTLADKQCLVGIGSGASTLFMPAWQDGWTTWPNYAFRSIWPKSIRAVSSNCLQLLRLAGCF
jgi:hypothetical protein